MEIVNWIDKKLLEVKSTLLYGKYFDSILLEEGIDNFVLLNRYAGIDMILSDDLIIKSIHFYSGNQKGASKFADKLPFNINFTFSRDRTRNILGDPTEKGGGGYSLLYGVAPNWDKYIYDTYILHLQFLANDEAVDLVTIDSRVK